jgi:hypothetical protein
MRPSYLHVFTGLLLGLALAGLFHLPGRIVAHQESVPSIGSPVPSRPGRDVVVQVSPKVERALAAARERRSRPRPVKRPTPHVVPVRSAPATSAPILVSAVEPPASAEPTPPTPEPTAPATEPAPPPPPAPEPAPPPPPAPAPEPAPPPPPKVTVPTPTTPSPTPVEVGKRKHEKKPKAEKQQKQEAQTAEKPKEQDAGWPEKPEKQSDAEKKGRDK